MQRWTSNFNQKWNQTWPKVTKNRQFPCRFTVSSIRWIWYRRRSETRCTRRGELNWSSSQNLFRLGACYSDLSPASPILFFLSPLRSLHQIPTSSPIPLRSPPPLNIIFLICRTFLKSGHRALTLTIPSPDFMFRYLHLGWDAVQRVEYDYVAVDPQQRGPHPQSQEVRRPHRRWRGTLVLVVVVVVVFPLLCPKIGETSCFTHRQVLEWLVTTSPSPEIRIFFSALLNQPLRLSQVPQL